MAKNAPRLTDVRFSLIGGFFRAFSGLCHCLAPGGDVVVDAGHVAGSTQRLGLRFIRSARLIQEDGHKIREAEVSRAFPRFVAKQGLAVTDEPWEDKGERASRLAGSY